MSVGTVVSRAIDERVVAGWREGPRQPTLAAGAVHVWRAELSSVEDDVTELLDAGERERATCIVDRQKRRHWSRSRGALRALLGRYLDADPRTLSFACSAHGKPILVGTDGIDRPSLHFNLSHSRDLALYAVAADRAVGVDVQLLRTRQTQNAGDRLALARRTFGERQAQRLRALDPGEREHEFMRLWTRREAELKRRSIGMASGSLAPIEELSAWIVELDVRTDAAAAVACAEAPSELRIWDWPLEWRTTGVGRLDSSKS
ncbi:MAG TPA: 4'-phosphopantetheinyl transferase superfamily protein [Solirubrobacteraceae bacterium]|nr:4'-phosphopantetheinyl transferase superfamily protein [Solirubrobacteraceae bacterium]